MIKNKQDYYGYLDSDSINYRIISGKAGFTKWLKTRLFATPISDQSMIWLYIKTLRKCEYYLNTRDHSVWGVIKLVMYFYYLHRLRVLSRKTSFQIPPNTIGKGLTIWHWGPIIINPNTIIGENCIIRPDIVVGYKGRGGKAPIIGNNVTLNSGSRVIGNDIVIGDDVIVAPGAVVTKSIPSHCVVAGVPAKVISKR